MSNKNILEYEIYDQEHQKLKVGREKENIFDKKKIQINLLIIFTITGLLCVLLLQKYFEAISQIIFDYMSINYKQNFQNLTIIDKMFFYFSTDNHIIHLKLSIVFIIFNFTNNYVTMTLFLFNTVGIICDVFYKLITRTTFQQINVVSLILILSVLNSSIYYKSKVNSRIMLILKLIFSISMSLLVIFWTIYFNCILQANNPLESNNNNIVQYLIFSISISLLIFYFYFKILDVNYDNLKQYYIYVNIDNNPSILISFGIVFSLFLLFVELFMSEIEISFYQNISHSFFFLGYLISESLEYYIVFEKNFYLFSKYNLISNSQSRNFINYMFNSTIYIKSVIRTFVMIIFYLIFNYLLETYFTNLILTFLCIFLQTVFIFYCLKRIFRLNFINLTNDLIFDNFNNLRNQNRDTTDNYYLFLESESDNESTISNHKFNIND